MPFNLIPETLVNELLTLSSTQEEIPLGPIKVPATRWEKIKEGVVNILDGVLSIIIISVVTANYVKRQLKDSGSLLRTISRTLSKDTEIASILHKLTEASNASRTVLGVIHNSSIYAVNYHLLKISILHESLSPHTKSIKQTVKDVPLAYLEEEMKVYKNNNNEFIFSITDADIKPLCRAHLNNINVSTLINFLITFKNIPIAILSFQYENDCPFDSIADLDRHIKSVTGRDINYYKDKLLFLLT